MMMVRWQIRFSSNPNLDFVVIEYAESHDESQVSRPVYVTTDVTRTDN
jgi:hypothetical protein